MDIAACPLFSGLSPEELRAALSLLRAREESYPKGALLNPGLTLSAFGYVLTGCVQVTGYDYEGEPMIMATVEQGGCFGEGLSFLKADTEVYIYATEADTSVLWLSPEALTNTDDPFAGRLLYRFTRLMAQRLLSLNDRIQVLSKHSLREKILTYLSQYAAKTGKESFRIPMDRERLSVFLGCERSALSRELSRLSREGIISFCKNQFTLHRHKNLG